MRPADFNYARDDEGVVHLADESPLGGLAIVCDDWSVTTVRVVEDVPDGNVCPDCLATIRSLT